MERMHKSQLRQLMVYFTLAVSVLGVYWIITHMDVIGGWIAWFFNVMGPFIAGFIIAYVLSIPVNSTQRLFQRTNIGFIQRYKKSLSVIVVYLSFIFIVYISIWLLIPPTITALTDLVASFPEYYQQLLRFVENINREETIPLYLNIEEFLQDFLGLDTSNPLTFISPDAIMSYIGTIMGGATVVFRTFLAFISSIYFLFEAENLGKFLVRLMNAFSSGKTSSVILGYGHKINQYFKKYIFCLIADCIIMGVVGTIILTIIGSPYAVFLGLLLGVMNLIPYFGSIIATAVAVIVVLLTQGFAMGIVSAIILLITQQIDANVVQPRLYGTSLKISPLLVIISVSVGGSVGGLIGGAVGGTIMGMIVAIPCAKVLMNILDDIIEYRESNKKSKDFPHRDNENIS